MSPSVSANPSLFDGVDLIGVTWRGISRDEANAALVSWEHKMGPMRRVDYGDEACHGLIEDGKILAITTTSGLVREAVGGAPWATRETAIELSRLCASDKDLNRVALRLWRRFSFPKFGKRWAISYQDSDLHTGATYRNDGWTRVCHSAGASSVDQRTGRQGRNKWVWVWPEPPVEASPSGRAGGG